MAAKEGGRRSAHRSANRQPARLRRPDLDLAIKDRVELVTMAEDGVDQPEGREASVELGTSRLETPLVLAAVTRSPSASAPVIAVMSGQRGHAQEVSGELIPQHQGRRAALG